jgi:hypothetical protein
MSSRFRLLPTEFMDRLWAPWRLGYIINNAQKKSGCFLCEALEKKDDKEAYILHRAEHCYVIMNLYPYNNGHLLIVPNSHVADIDLLSPEGFCELMKMTQIAVNILKQDMFISRWSPDGTGIQALSRFSTVPESCRSFLMERTSA